MQLIAHCVSWRIVGRRRSQSSSPVWHPKGAEPAASCSPSSRWLTACWPMGGTLIWLMLTWRYSWRSANQSSAHNSLLWKSFLSFLFVIRFCFVFQLHLRSLSQDSVAMAALLRLSSRLEAGWTELQSSFDQSLCLLSYAKSALLWQCFCYVLY